MGVAVGVPMAAADVGTGVGLSVPLAPVAGDAVGTGVGELVADGEVESAAPASVLAD